MILSLRFKSYTRNVGRQLCGDFVRGHRRLSPLPSGPAVFIWRMGDDATETPTQFLRRRAPKNKKTAALGARLQNAKKGADL
jgi:hypothetical protein